MGGPGLGLMLTPEVVEQIGLTEEQESKLKDLRDAHQDQVLEIKQKIERAELELARLTEDDNPSESKITAKIREISSLRTDLQLAGVELYFAARKILTDEQIEKLKTLRPALGAGRGPGPCRGGDGNPRGGPEGAGPHTQD